MNEWRKNEKDEGKRRKIEIKTGKWGKGEEMARGGGEIGKD